MAKVDVTIQRHGEGPRWGMVIDLQKCVGCDSCTVACKAENRTPPGVTYNVVVEEQTGTFPNVRHVNIPRPCMQCDNPPCVAVCPVNATYKAEDGTVVIDHDRCIGCRYCMVACPYDARRFNWTARTDENPYQPEWGSAEVPRRPRGVVEKCTFCVHRIDRGLEEGLTPGVDRAATPACVNICPVGARKFGDVNDPNSEVAKIISSTPTFRLKEDLGTEPNVYYVPPEGMVIT